MSRFVKAIFALCALILLVVALCTFTGVLTGFFFKEDVVALQGQSKLVQDDILAATGFKAAVNFSLKQSFTNNEKMVGVVVTYDFIPPNTDRSKLYLAAEEAVRKHVKNLSGFEVTGIRNPNSLPPNLRKPPPESTAAAPPPVAVDAGVSAHDEKPPAKPGARSGGGKGTLTLFTIPAGAVVSLQGKSLGNTPLLKTPVPAGTQLLLLTFPDGAKKQFSAKIAPNALSKFKFNKDELPDG